MRTTAKTELDDDTQDRRWALVDDLFGRLTSRPGRTVTNGISVTDAAVADIVTGDTTPMEWLDEPALERLGRTIADPYVADADLTYHVAFAAASAELAADTHELCEHFTVDGVRVFDPHPTGRRFEPWVPANVELRDTRRPPAPWVGTAPRDWLEVPAPTVRRAAADLCARVDLGPFGRFEAAGDVLCHEADYADRETGDVQEFTWCREVLGDFTIAADGNPGAALRSALVVTMLDTVLQSLTHEIAEWLHIDGVRVFDPHPGECGAQIEILVPRLELGVSPLVPATAS